MLHSGQQGGVCNVSNAQFSRPSALQSFVGARCAALLAMSCCLANAAGVTDVRALVDAGHFKQADAAISALLSAR